MLISNIQILVLVIEPNIYLQTTKILKRLYLYFTEIKSKDFELDIR